MKCRKHEFNIAIDQSIKFGNKENVTFNILIEKLCHLGLIELSQAVIRWLDTSSPVCQLTSLSVKDNIYQGLVTTNTHQHEILEKIESFIDFPNSITLVIDDGDTTTDTVRQGIARCLLSSSDIVSGQMFL